MFGDNAVSAEVRNRVYREMIAEIDARIAPLQRERAELQKAAERLATIDVTLQVLRAEREEYDALLPREPILATAAERAELVEGLTRHME